MPRCFTSRENGDVTLQYHFRDVFLSIITAIPRLPFGSLLWDFVSWLLIRGKNRQNKGSTLSFKR